jgi:hypothetical protein
MAVGVQADPSKDSAAWWEAQRQTMPPYEFLRKCLPGAPIFSEGSWSVA